MRLFIAIQLTDEVRNSLTDTMHLLKKAGVKGSFSPAQNLHLTCVFIGETRETEKVKAAMQTVSFKPFRLSFSGLGTFGDILYAGMKGNQGLSGVVKSLKEALSAAGISYDDQKFVPHITLIRKMTGKWQQIPAPKGEMMVKKISLMKSVQKDGKMVYSEIFSI